MLREIDAGDVPQLLAFNKADLDPETAAVLVKRHPGSVAFSARTGAGVDELLETVSTHLRAMQPVVELVDPLRPRRHPGRSPPGGGGPGRDPRRGRYHGAGPARLGLTSPVRRVRGDDRGRTVTGFQPPPYPYDRLDPLRAQAARTSTAARSTCPSAPRSTPRRNWSSRPSVPPTPAATHPRSARRRSGTPRVAWLDRYLGVTVGPDAVAACIGTKEFVAGAPSWLRLRSPDRDTVLYPAISYPTYEMGATLAGCRAVAVAVRDDWTIDLASIDEADAARAVCLWVNTPGNPAGGLDDLGAAARWGRAHGVPVLSDECYVAFTWDGPPRSILHHGSEGVVAVHSLSKRSNLAGARAGFYAGDPDLVGYLREVRKHAGFMVPAPVQAAAAAALGDEHHVDEQRSRYRSRLESLRAVFADALDIDVEMPGGAFYLWVPAPGGDAWALTERLAAVAGAIVSPGEFYGRAGEGHIRVAAVQPDDRIALVVDRLRAAVS